MNTIIVNGMKIQTNGKNISINNDVIKVNGKVIMSDLSGQVDIRFEGDLANLECDGNVTVNGIVNGDINAGGNISCGAVGRDADAGGNIICGNVGRDIDAGGNISMKR